MQAFLNLFKQTRRVMISPWTGVILAIMGIIGNYQLLPCQNFFSLASQFGTCRSEKPSPISLPNNKLFVHADGALRDDLSRGLQNAGFEVAPDQAASGLIVNVEGPTVSRDSQFGSRLTWTYTAKARVTVRRAQDNTLVLDPPEFVATTPPSINDTHGAALAKAQIIEKINGYLRDNIKSN